MDLPPKKLTLSVIPFTVNLHYNYFVHDNTKNKMYNNKQANCEIEKCTLYIAVASDTLYSCLDTNNKIKHTHTKRKPETPYSGTPARKSSFPCSHWVPNCVKNDMHLPLPCYPCMWCDGRLKAVPAESGKGSLLSLSY